MRSRAFPPHAKSRRNLISRALALLALLFMATTASGTAASCMESRHAGPAPCHIAGDCGGHQSDMDSGGFMTCTAMCAAVEPQAPRLEPPYIAPAAALAAPSRILVERNFEPDPPPPRG